MNILIAVLISLSLPIQSYATSSTCSLENSKKLLGLTAKFIGEVGSDNVKMNSILFDQKIIDLKEARKQFKDIRNASKAGAASEEITTFVAAHPECDKEGNFRVTLPIN